MADTPTPSPETQAAPATAAPASVPAGPKAAAKAPASVGVARQVPFNVRVARGMNALGGAISVLFTGLFSRDGWTRAMTLVFYGSTVGLVATFFWGAKMLRDGQGTNPGGQAEKIGKFFEKQRESAGRVESQVALGKFTVELKPPEGRVPRGVVNLAELEIVVACTTREACEFLEARMELVRDQVTSVFVYLDREELMTFQGKRRIKAQIQRKLGSLLSSGSVSEVYIVKLLIS
ncbi:MAG: flagellar basal body-associated FliL family protein [Bdellovibrionales bacterium]|nr:flagellar basal body-associated FliL family protein [Bdellovibrionales bacterium]